MSITAPYNFVPLNKNVVIPYWGDFVSHDIPFQDAMSGVIDITIEAKSPIFISDPEKKEMINSPQDRPNANARYASLFCQDNMGKFFIPGSSLRGMLRNITEIMTFSRMRQLTERRFSVRDFQNKSLYNPSKITGDVKAGYLRKDRESGNYYLENCGEPGRIHIDQISGELRQRFLYKNRNESRTLTAREKASRYKYRQYNGAYQINVIAAARMQNGLTRYVLAENSNEDGDIKSGTIVFTGQPAYRKEKRDNDGKLLKEGTSGKVYEFLFFRNTTNPDLVEVPESVIETFRLAYFDLDNEGNQSIDWKHWKKKLEKGEEIPVFFRTVREANQEVIRDMGLSYLYKISYNHTAYELIQNYQQGKGSDMAQLIFGHTDEVKEENALKGRIHIDHAYTTQNQALPVVEAILSSPKATYYPNYIRQNGTGNYQTYMDQSAVPSGWKKYPIQPLRAHSQSDPINENVAQRPQNTDILTAFRPLDAGTTFHTRITYHNLKKIELGALISALSFHKSPNTFHNIGMGKPLGYGKVEISFQLQAEQEETLKYFEAFMESELNQEWKSSDQLKELIAMAKDQVTERNVGPEKLAYMSLQGFVGGKKDKHWLKKYSQLLTANPPNPIIPTQITDPEFQDSFIAELEQEKTIFRSREDQQEVIEKWVANTRASFTQSLKQKKEELINRIKARQQQIKAEEKARIKELEKAKVRKAGLSYDGLEEIKPRDRFDELKKQTNAYLEVYYAEDKLDKIFKEMPEGIVPDPDRKTVINGITLSFKGLNTKKRLKWLNGKDKFVNLQLITWLGEKGMQELLKELEKIQK